MKNMIGRVVLKGSQAISHIITSILIVSMLFWLALVSSVLFVAYLKGLVQPTSLFFIAATSLPGVAVLLIALPNLLVLWVLSRIIRLVGGPTKRLRLPR